MKTTLALILFLIAGQFCYGQTHDEGVHSGDLVKSIQVYPNPASDYLTVKFENPVAKTSKLVFHSIIGSSLELEQEVVDDFEVRIKVKDLPMGYYVMVVVDPQTNGRAIQKFLKR